MELSLRSLSLGNLVSMISLSRMIPMYSKLRVGPTVFRNWIFKIELGKYGQQDLHGLLSWAIQKKYGAEVIRQMQIKLHIAFILCNPCYGSGLFIEYFRTRMTSKHQPGVNIVYILPFYPMQALRGCKCTCHINFTSPRLLIKKSIKVTGKADCKGLTFLIHFHEGRPGPVLILLTLDRY